MMAGSAFAATRRLAMVVRLAGVPRRSFGVEALRGPVSVTTKRKKKRQAKAAPKVLSAADFNALAEAFVARVERGFDDAVKVNAGSSLRRDDDGDLIVDWGDGKGEMRFNVNVANKTIDVVSPISGGLQYAYDASANAWLHVIDRHDARGIIVRDFLRAGCVGLPDV
mmetsp:Transcript_32450/g.103467  ORF Transcript_32450/g.103467 Transcript_32450/m.103467 type:complete len:167 (-) Transcript_32450:244-744(-)